MQNTIKNNASRETTQRTPFFDDSFLDESTEQPTPTGKRKHAQIAKEINVVGYCKQHGIPYFPIILEIKDGKKHLSMIGFWYLAAPTQWSRAQESMRRARVPKRQE